MRKILAVAGQPGTGKTTLFRRFIAQHQWAVVEPKKTLNGLYCAELDLYILGKYAEGEVFSGTDKLSMSVQPMADAFVKETQSNVLFEGDRLTNGKFYDALLSLPDTEVNFLILSAKDATLKARYAERGSDQSETFLRGRETKIAKILSNFDYRPNIVEFENENLLDQDRVLNFVNQFFSKQ
jgi:broad-specificity NMP kinase